MADPIYPVDKDLESERLPDGNLIDIWDNFVMEWGKISGSIYNQSDLIDYINNKIPATQIQGDWNQADATALDYIKNKIVSLTQLNDNPTHRLVTDTQINTWDAKAPTDNPSFTTQITTNAVNIITDTTTGLKIGTGITQKIGFYNSTPVIQKASASQASVSTVPPTQTNAWGFGSSAQATAIITLVNELRLALVNLGLIKGSA